MYDLILKDATLVSSIGRVVADVAIQDGLIAYVGPRPRRAAKVEISAMGRFLIPGIIDTAVQFDHNDSSELWSQESKAAVTGGVTTVLALPEGKKPVVDARSAETRLKRVKGKSWCNYGLWGAAMYNNAREMEVCYQKGLIQGVLMTVDDNAEGLAIRPQDAGKFVQYPGVLGMKLQTPKEEEGIRHLLGAVHPHFKKVHLMNLTRTVELNVLDPVRGTVPATAGVTPHHLFLSEEEDNRSEVDRMPLCAERDRRSLWTAVKRGRLSCIASDHHSQMNSEHSVVPGSELLFSLMMSAVQAGRLSMERFVSLCCEAPADIFGLTNKGRIEKGMDADLVVFSEGVMNKVDDSLLLSTAGWSPYNNRDAASKPELVIVGGTVVSQNGSLVGQNPTGRWVGEN